MTDPDWPSLWELEPGLRPPEVEYNEKLVEYGIGWQLTIECRPLCPPIRAYGDAEMVAPYCRDAAVRWLAATVGGCEVRYPEKVRGKVTHAVALSGPGCDPCDIGGDGGWFIAPTLDAALFAACRAVVEARATAGGQR